jgi:hypothetical protein
MRPLRLAGAGDLIRLRNITRGQAPAQQSVSSQLPAHSTLFPFPFAESSRQVPVLVPVVPVQDGRASRPAPPTTARCIMPVLHCHVRCQKSPRRTALTNYQPSCHHFLQLASRRLASSRLVPSPAVQTEKRRRRRARETKKPN